MTRKTAFLSLIFLFFFTAVILILSKDASAFKLPDTGQMKCYQSVSPYAEIPCAGTGQDGEYNINPMSYTDNSDGTVTDNNTGLMWQQGENPTTYNWYKASGTYDATYNPTSQNVCSELTTGGYSDWRLPTKKELIGIVDYSIPTPGPTIKTAYFPIAYASYYWTSTISVSNYVPNSAWFMDFYDGDLYNSSKDNGHYVRCVRGGQLDFGNFTNNYDGTIIDTSTGLMWQQGELEYMSWYSALSYCENLELPSGSGQTDWRLPNIKELESITDDTRYLPAIDTTFFLNAHASSYRSSTTNVGYLPYPGYAWGVQFVIGSVGAPSKYSEGVNVRCVMGPFELFDYYCDDDSDTYIDSSIDATCAGDGCFPAGCQTTPGNNCNDSDPLEHPNQGWDEDVDRDGYSSGNSVVQCSRPTGYKAASELTATSGDCNDSNSLEYPNQTWYKDTDNDLYSSGDIIVQCARPAGYKATSELTSTSGDGNDNDSNVYPKTRVTGAGTTYYSTLQSAYNASSTGDTIQSHVDTFTENLSLNLSKTVTLQGGYNSGYTSITGKTTINGNVTISNGKITIGDLIIQ